VRRRSPLLALLVVLVPGMLVLGIWLGGHPDRLPGGVRDALVGDSHAQLFQDAVDRIESDYYRKVDPNTLTNDGIAGMVASLNDRYSHYFTPAEFHHFQQQTDAVFTGIGVEVRTDKRRRGLLIVKVYDDSPAKKAGLKSGDVIVAAGGESLAGKSSAAASAVIRGRIGTTVKLAYVRDGVRRTTTAKREEVSIPVVASAMRTLPDGTKVAQVALSTFSTGAHGELRSAIDKRLEQGAKGIVLDLRHNGGGLVEEARLVASIFIPEGPIVTMKGRSQPTRTLTASGDAISTKIPVVVLVDGETASAAEIVAGALQDRDRAEIVGTHTYGKGVFQQVEQLPNGGALDLTVGEYFLPSGRNLGGGGVNRGAGIQPDVKASDDPDTPKDEAVATALDQLAKKLGS
jgi:carboxyl-terminal processing protease